MITFKVGEFADSFIECIEALKPIFSRIGIETNDAAYDGWERIEDSLFKSIFSDAVDNDPSIPFTLVDYNFDIKSLKDKCFLGFQQNGDYYFVNKLCRSHDKKIICESTKIKSFEIGSDIKKYRVLRENLGIFFIMDNEITQKYSICFHE
jgi:hypothetical protein